MLRSSKWIGLGLWVTVAFPYHFGFFFWFLVFGFFLGIIQKLVVVDVIVTTVAITP